jgi:hypothetical protein
MGELIIQVIYVLIAIACVVGLYYLVVWVLDYLGIPVPQMVLRIVFLIIALFILAWVVSIFVGGSTIGFMPPMRR